MLADRKSTRGEKYSRPNTHIPLTWIWVSLLPDLMLAASGASYMAFWSTSSQGKRAEPI